MRLVAKHAQVGYQTPGERPGCRNCLYFEQGRRETIATTVATLCLKHGIEITSGGICPSHKLVHAGPSVDPRQLAIALPPQAGEVRA